MDFPQPFIVVDQNHLRKPDVIGGIVGQCRRHGLGVLLADGAFYELSKGTQPHDTWTRSLVLLASQRDLVWASRKFTTMMAEEVQQGAPVRTLVDENTSEPLRSILGDLERGDDEQIQRIVDGPMAELLPASKQLWSDHEKFKGMLQYVHDEVKRHLAEEQLKQLRKDPQRAALQWLSTPTAIGLVTQGITKIYGGSRATALELSFNPSVTAAFLSEFFGLAADWVAFDGLTGKVAESIVNDFHDLEYVLLGALSHGLSTSDRRAKRLCDAVKSSFTTRMSYAPYLPLVREHLGV